MTEANQSRTEAAERRVPERSAESSASASREVFSRVGDRDDLAAMNSHTRGDSNNNRTLELTDPFKSASSDMTSQLGSPPRSGNGAVEEVAGGRAKGNADRPNIPESLRQFMEPPTDPALLKDGVVKVTPTFPGTGRFTLDGSANGTGFLVNTNGDKAPSKPGEQLVATADHVIEDRRRKVYQMGPNLFKDKSELTKQDLAEAGDKALAGISDKKPGEIFKSERDYARDELNYINGNFDKIQQVSKELNPGAKGITLDGLDEYRRRNTKIEVETAAGRFNAQIANRDPGADTAVLRISKLTPEQQAKMGPNHLLETRELKTDQPVKSVGYRKTVDSAIMGTEQLHELKDSTESIVVDKPLAPGMSGGPTFSKDYRVIGINHAGDSRQGFVTPIDDLAPLLREIASGKVPIRRSLDR